MPPRRASTMLRPASTLLLATALLSGCHTTAGSLFSRHGKSADTHPTAVPPPVPSSAPLTGPGDPSRQPTAQPFLTPAKHVVTSGTELQWQLRSSQERPDLVRAGRGVVGPDGALVLGPYGSCNVAGLTLDKASQKVEKHLASYVKNPSVRLSTTPQEATDVAWRAARPAQPGSATTAVALSSPAKTGKREVPVRMVGNWQSGDREKNPILPLPPPLAVDEQDDGLPKVPPLPPVTPTPPPVATTPPPPAAKTPPAASTFVPPPPSVVAPPATVQTPTLGHAPLASSVPLGTAGLHGAPVAMGLPPGPRVALGPNEMSRLLLPAYVIGPPDVLQVESLKGLTTQPVRGPHLVRPDGTVNIGAYGSVLVAGMTIDQAKYAIAQTILNRLDPDKVTLKDVVEGLSVDVLAYNSKVYYVITDGGGLGEQVYPFPITGNETVLDAIGRINGLPPVSSKKHIWVARRTPGMGSVPKILPVDWCGITQRGETATNYQVMPGDRVYVQADRVRTFDNNLAKILSPIERLFGVTLLGSQTVGSVRNGGLNNGTGR